MNLDENNNKDELLYLKKIINLFNMNLDETLNKKIDNLNIKTQGKPGNMTTYFLNSEDIAGKINRDSKLFGKYISTSLSCPSGVDKEKKCLTFKGTYTFEQIYKYFMEFVQVYVLCPICDYPEIKLYNQKPKSFHSSALLIFTEKNKYKPRSCLQIEL